MTTDPALDVIPSTLTEVALQACMSQLSGNIVLAITKSFNV